MKARCCIQVLFHCVHDLTSFLTVCHQANAHGPPNKSNQVQQRDRKRAEVLDRSQSRAGALGIVG